MLESWVNRTAGKELLFEEHARPALEKFKEEYEGYEKLCNEIHSKQQTMSCSDSIADIPQSVETAWELGCDVSGVSERQDELLDDLINVNQELKRQRDTNGQLGRSIQNVEAVLNQYECDTRIKPVTSPRDSIEMLKAKQAEYWTLISRHSQYSADVSELCEILELTERLEALDNELAIYHHLPPDIPDALTMIASAEAELQELANKIDAKLK